MWRNVTYVRMILCFGRSYVEKVRGKLCEDSIFDVTYITALHTELWALWTGSGICEGALVQGFGVIIFDTLPVKRGGA